LTLLEKAGYLKRHAEALVGTISGLNARERQRGPSLSLMKTIWRFVAICAVLFFVAFPARSTSDEYFVYYGTYTGFKYIAKGEPTGHSTSQGIYVSRFRPSTGEITDPQLAVKAVNPSFLAVHPNRKFLYAVIEDPLSVGPYRDKASSVSAYAIDQATGKLRLLNTVPANGTSTCYVSIDPAGKYVMVANFGNGSVAVFPVKSDGSLGPQSGFDQHKGKSVDPGYQAGPHAHSIDVTPDERFAVSSDLGMDKLLVYRFDAQTGALTPNPAGPSLTIKPLTGGPRHFVFSKDGQFGYSLSEMSGVITAVKMDRTQGVLSTIQTLTMKPKSFDENSNIVRLNPYHSGEIALLPGGKFLYASNRGPDTIAVLQVDAVKGTVTPVEEVSSRGLIPRAFGIDPTGSYIFVANQASDDIIPFLIDNRTGRLAPTRQIIRVNSPSCVVFALIK
jgi:6-phosphogluconolactonase